MAVQPDKRIIELEEELRKTQKLLKESRKNDRIAEFYNGMGTYQILKNLPVGLNIFDSKGKVVFVNNIARSYFGVAEDDQLDGYNFFDDPSISDAIKWKVRHKQGATEERYIDFQIIKEHKMYESSKSKNDQMFIRLIYKPIEAKSGESSGIIVIIEDLTSQNVTEKALKESEVRFRELFQNMSSSVAVYNAVENGSDFVFVDFNKSAEKLDKLSKGIIIGKKVTEMFPGVEAMEIFEIFKRVWKTGESEKCPVFEYKNDKISGWRENFVYKLPTGEIVAIYDDLTEQKRIEYQLAQLQKMESVGQLAGGIAHNFNNVLSVIMNAAQLLQMPARKLDQKSQKYTEMIMKSSNTAKDLINKLLAFGRRKQFLIEKQNLDSILKETVDILEGTLDRRTSVSLLSKAENPQILGDHSGLENVFLNLCLNANDAMEDGGEILISTENTNLDQLYCNKSLFDIKPGKFYKITISDTGSGIPPENLQKIFDPFYTTKEQGKGTGLGLSAVYGIIQAHNGEILVKSEPDKGTSFFIFIPCVNEEGFAPSDRCTILFAEEEGFNRLLGAELLESQGYRVLQVKNGQEAIDIYEDKNNEIDIVIMNMVMPEINGFDAFIKMREINHNSKVIITSGHMEDESIKDLKRLGLKGFLQKPYKDSDLTSLLMEIRE